MVSQILSGAPPQPDPGTGHGTTEGACDLGLTRMLDEEIFALLRESIGHVYVPSRVSDNTQLNAELDGVCQTVATLLSGLELPEITAGEVGETNPYFAFITDKPVWSDMAYRMEEMVTNGIP